VNARGPFRLEGKIMIVIKFDDRHRGATEARKKKRRVMRRGDVRG
jgi:hypothetical protein